MNLKPCIVLFSFAALGMPLTASAQIPMGTEFTYQGLLRASGMPSVTTADFQFELFDAATEGTKIGATITRENVAVVDGLFTLSLDFGAAAFKGDSRWLLVAVRSPAGTGGFTTLSPRQPLTATPYASQTRGITVDENNRVGIGTPNPVKQLSVAGDMEIGLGETDYRHLRLGGGSSDGFLYGSFPALGDGIHLGYNHFADAAGNHQVIHTTSGTSRVTVGNGTITFAASSQGGAPPVNRVAVDSNGLRVIVGNIVIPPKLRSYTIHPYALGVVHHEDSSGAIYERTDVGLNVLGSPKQFATSVQLPDGARVVMLEVLGHDGATSTGFDIVTTLGRSTFSGASFLMATSTSEFGGSVWQTTSISSPDIDNDTNSYWVRVSLGGGVPPFDTTLYAIRILYEITQPLP